MIPSGFDNLLASATIDNRQNDPQPQVQQFTLDQGLGVATQISDTGKKRISRAQRSDSISEVARGLNNSQVEEGLANELITREDLC
jgi:hypothetical protein